MEVTSMNGWSTAGRTRPVRYSIETSCALPRYTPVGRFRVLRHEKTCINCGRCIKECIYDVHRRKHEDPRLMDEPLSHLCKNCFRCIQQCPTRSLSKILNPEYLRLGDEYWTPEIITSTWLQAETGRIPVFGAGYRGPFSGPGFDSMWTDMSEIVRPTRDGIHGREYIHTGIDLGRKPDHLEFDGAGNLAGLPARVVHLPIPVLFGAFPVDLYGTKVAEAVCLAARSLGTFFAFDPGNWPSLLNRYSSSGVPRIGDDLEKARASIQGAAMVEIPFSKDWGKKLEQIRKINPDALVSVALPFTPDADTAVEALAAGSADVIHLMADRHGRAPLLPGSPFLKDALQWIHLHLVEKRIRDEVTLLASGGIAAAEHVPKAIISGADGVVITYPLLIGLECLACRECSLPDTCPREIRHIDPDWGATRMINLMAAWQNQLLEVLGAMGLREVRRLRGETGRALYFDQLEREVFQEEFR
ncbi:MAG: 4Fe-4S dicluster domain-containing protein [Deltaproteobacteria bacterium]|nr:4Fe-4S dicluster domain-containing protein [Deltaproteobacteria bacterium]